MSATAQQLYEICDGTWPAAVTKRLGPWTLRDGKGGGKRVSAATAEGSVQKMDIRTAEVGMQDMGQTPLFMIRDGDEALDQLLESHGYKVVDPVVMYSIPVNALTEIEIPLVTTFCVWEPLAIMAEIWAEGGIGPARLDVMARAINKTGILSRWNEQPAGAAFAAISDGICMVHAVEILEHQRRQGVGVWMMRQAAFWAAEQGVQELAVLCTTANIAANGLYKSLGFSAKGHYHYRQIQKETS
ncbi:MAG: GNAT family N-acetyltransferase [Ascidiaceihabitans sp.]|jgi:GNAT superfamily N-acetyltransferase|tara:strand:- start:2205 stop:2933 length:729 start_codon:yes stop_codon:yes gene_type:complete